MWTTQDFLRIILKIMLNRKEVNRIVTVYVMSVNGKCLMPTNRCGHIRHLLKDGKAKIVSRHPFTVQLLYESGEHTQPLEIGVDFGYIHVGVSVKSRDRGWII